MADGGGLHRALCPRVAVLCSPDVETIAQANGAAHLVDLLRAFECSAERGVFAAPGFH